MLVAKINATMRGLLRSAKRTRLGPFTSRIPCRTIGSRFQSTTEDAQAKNRHPGIQMHPDSISSKVLPGNYVIKENRSGDNRKRYTELVYGYFWAIKDLNRCGNKPILSNERLIPEDQAKLFPPLDRVQTLSGVKMSLPDYFMRKNRSRDTHAQCTFVGVSFRDFGYQLLPSWLECPAMEQLQSMSRVEIFRLNIAEGWLSQYLLRGLIQGTMKRNTPKNLHDATLLCFGNVDGFRDALRMHNVMTGYVFLLDGLGRVRFAGSGSASDEEVSRLVAFAKEMIESKPKIKR